MSTPPPEMTCGFLIQLVFCKKRKTMWFIGVEVEQETSTPPPKKNPGSAPVMRARLRGQDFATGKNFSFNRCHTKSFAFFLGKFIV